MKKVILSLLILAAFQQIASAQDTAKAKKNFKNTVHVNITNPIIFTGNSFVIGYERVLKKNRSFSVNFGTNGFPSLGLISSDSIKLNTIRDNNGFNFSADYRFYLSKENKYNAPRGVYIGPYYSFNYFENKNSWLIKSSSGGVEQSVDTKTKLSVNGVGFEMGYQYVLWNRVTLDCILAGPGIATYNLRTEIGSNLSANDEAELLEKLNEALADKFPGYNLVIDDLDFQKKGSSKTTTFGFRYMVQVGFRF